MGKRKSSIQKRRNELVVESTMKKKLRNTLRNRKKNQTASKKRVSLVEKTSVGKTPKPLDQNEIEREMKRSDLYVLSDVDNLFSRTGIACRCITHKAFGNNDNGGVDRDSSYSFPARSSSWEHDEITLDSVGGLNEQINYLKKSVLLPIKHTEAARKWGLEAPKGVMFYGPPGTGKTLLAKAIANELGKELGKKVPFFYRKGGDLFDKYFGESSRKIRELFYDARQRSPSIIFFDEIDGLCPSREKDHGTEAYNSVVTSLLGVIDEVKRGEVVIFAATNRLESVDQAIRRPGRFDKELAFLPPDTKGRKDIIGIHVRKWPSDKPGEEFLSYLAKCTAGCTGADLEKLCREAFSNAFDRNYPDISSAASLQLDDLHVLPCDWETALKKMKRSNSSIYGSALYTPEPPSEVIVPLIDGICNEIEKILVPLMPADTLKGSIGIHSCLITDNSQCSSFFVDDTIIPHVLTCHEQFDKAAKYLVNMEGLLCSSQANPISFFTSVINKACSNISDSSILFIPRIDVLMSSLKKEISSVFTEHLMILRGKSVLLIATAASVSSIESPEVRFLFAGINRSYKIRNFKRKERENFFSTIFHQLGKYVEMHDKKHLPRWEKEILPLKQSCVDLTERDTVDQILSLHGELSLHCSLLCEQNKNCQVINEALRDIVEKYKLNKLE